MTNQYTNPGASPTIRGIQTAIDASYPMLFSTTTFGI